MNEIRHIVFDIGKVLIHYDPKIPFRRLIPDDTKRRWFLDNVCTTQWNLEQDRGRGWDAAEAELIARYPEHEENIRAFRRCWHEMVSHAYEDSVGILESLVDAGHDVTMLTNFAADTFTEARKRFPFLDRPRGVTVSGAVRLIKPEPEIYEHHVVSFDLEPTATLLIDDSPPNVDAARQVGWHAVRFVDAETLRQDLRRYGVAA